MTRWGWIALIVSALTIAGSAVAQVALHDRMPEQVPVHWGLDGQPDRWVSKNDVGQVYYLLPTIGFGVIALGLFVLPWLSPKNFAVESFRRTYDYVFAVVAVMLCYMQFIMLSAAMQGGPMPERALIAGIFVFLALIGNVLGKVKRNFWMGVRTPWTLADAQVWERTHRVAAYSLTGVGIIGAIAALLGVSPIVCFVALMVAALWPVLYSLLLYKRLERAGQLCVQVREREAVGV